LARGETALDSPTAMRFPARYRRPKPPRAAPPGKRAGS